VRNCNACPFLPSWEERAAARTIATSAIGGVAECRGGFDGMTKQRHIPIRSCVVCRQTSDKRALLRVVRLPEKDGGQVVVDSTGKRSGRGAYICPEAECIDKAMKGKRFERSLAATSAQIASTLYDELKQLAVGRQPTPK